MNIDLILKKEFPQNNNIYYCLPRHILDNQVKKQDISTYSKRADKFEIEQMLNLSAEEQAIIKPLLDLPKDSVILELAGGNGRFIFHLAKQKRFQLIESDIAYGSVAKVKQVAEENNINNIEYTIIDAENLPFKDNSFNAIFMVASLHHLPKPEKAIAEIKRVLKSEGRILILREPAKWQYIIFYPLYLILRKALRKKNKNEFSLADDQTLGFSQTEIKQLLNEFVNIEIKPVHYTRKIYTNFIILFNKIFKTRIKANSVIENILISTDIIISKIPIIKSLSWDWDIYAQKK